LAFAAPLSKVWNDTRGASISRVIQSTVEGTAEATAVGDAETGSGWYAPRAPAAATMTVRKKDQSLVRE
jgi:hypothetical protein